MVGMYPEASERNHRPVRLLSMHRRSFEIYLHLFYRTDQFRKLALVCVRRHFAFSHGKV